MPERWPKILSAILAALLILTIAAYIGQGTELKALRGTYADALKTLQNQTNMVAELRKTLARESFRNFKSEQELRSWASNWVLTKMPLVIEFLGTDIKLRGEKYSRYQDCDDLAEAMQRDALKDGLLMSVALIRDGTMYGVKVTDLSPHAGIVAMADSTYWYVEPQFGTVVKIVERD